MADRGDTKRPALRQRVEQTTATLPLLLTRLPAATVTSALEWLRVRDLRIWRATSRAVANDPTLARVRNLFAEDAREVRGPEFLALLTATKPHLQGLRLPALHDSDDWLPIADLAGQLPMLRTLVVEVAMSTSYESVRHATNRWIRNVAGRPELKHLSEFRLMQDDPEALGSYMDGDIWADLIRAFQGTSHGREPFSVLMTDVSLPYTVSCADAFRALFAETQALGVGRNLTRLQLHAVATHSALAVLRASAPALRRLDLLESSFGDMEPNEDWTGADIGALLRECKALEHVAVRGVHPRHEHGPTAAVFRWERAVASDGKVSDWRMHQRIDEETFGSMHRVQTAQCMSAVFDLSSIVDAWASVVLLLPGNRRAKALLTEALDQHERDRGRPWACRDLTVAFPVEDSGPPPAGDVFGPLLRRVHGLERFYGRAVSDAQRTAGEYGTSWYLKDAEAHLEFDALSFTEVRAWLRDATPRQHLAFTQIDATFESHRYGLDATFESILDELLATPARPLESLVWERYGLLGDEDWILGGSVGQRPPTRELKHLLTRFRLRRLECGRAQRRDAHLVVWPPAAVEVCGRLGSALRALYLILDRNTLDEGDLMSLRGLEELGLQVLWGAPEHKVPAQIRRSTLAKLGAQNPDLRVLELGLGATLLDHDELDQPYVRNMPRLQRLSLHLRDTETLELDALVELCLASPALRQLTLLPGGANFWTGEEEKGTLEEIRARKADVDALEAGVGVLAGREWKDLRWTFPLSGGDSPYIRTAHPTDRRALAAWYPFLRRRAAAAAAAATSHVGDTKDVAMPQARAPSSGRVVLPTAGVSGGGVGVLAYTAEQLDARAENAQLARRLAARLRQRHGSGLRVDAAMLARIRSPAPSVLRAIHLRSDRLHIEWTDPADRTSLRRLVVERRCAELEQRLAAALR